MPTTQRSIRYGGHTKHMRYCSCGRQVSGNGGKRHFEREGHKRITWDQWWERFGRPE
jgi:hypothetical protein